jgi:hypothetical protein
MLFKKLLAWAMLSAGLTVVFAATSLAVTTTATNTGRDGSKVVNQKRLNANAWTIWTTNYGPFVNPQTGNSGGFWGGVQYGYIYGAGMWVGAELSNGQPVVAVGYNPSSGAAEFGPINPTTGDWKDYRTDLKARVYLSTDPTDLADWPIKNADGSPLIKSIQDGYSAFSDQNPVYTATGSVPLGVRVDQHSYAWNYADNNDIVFFYFKVTNVSGQSLNKMYIGPCVDADIGNEADGPTTPNDRTMFDYRKNLAIQFQSLPEDGWPKVGVLGMRYFESPINNTGATILVKDNQFQHNILPDSVLGMTAFKIFVRAGKVSDPNTDAEAYKIMRGIDFVTNIEDAYDEWGVDNAGDKRFIMVSGPFNLANNASAATCIGVMACATGDFAKDTILIKKVSDVAQEIYNNGFELATPPSAPVLSVTPGDKSVLLSWTRKSEITPDPFYEKIDSSMTWWTYFPGTWKYLRDTMLVSMFSIKTGESTYVMINRGAANPVNGTDTLQALYNQKAMYEPYDFQGYLIYRARTPSDLSDPAKREVLGTAYNNTTTGATSYAYDKIDGVQIVIDVSNNIVVYPGGSSDTTKKYDTLGTDRGLIYSYLDENVINNFGWYYGISAYDYQPNVYFTRKCPTSLVSNPGGNNAVFGMARTPTVDMKPAEVTFTSLGGSDARTSGGAVDYYNVLQIVNPQASKQDTFRLKWAATKLYSNPYNYPIYTGSMRDSIRVIVKDTAGTVISDSIVDSLLSTQSIAIKYDYLAGSSAPMFFGSFPNQNLFGGAISNPYVAWNYQGAKFDSLQVVEIAGGARTYPKDSIFTLVDTINVFKAEIARWQWRGSDIEIRWKDSIGQVGTNPSGNILTCTVWDITNNVEVPWEGGLTKANMTKSAWCFNPLSTSSGTTKYIDSTMVAGIGMHIAGVTMYFKRFGGVGTASRMSWPNRPETGDIWRAFCSGPRPPVDGETGIFITSKSIQITALSQSLLDNVRVVPNPYLVRAKWDASDDYPNIYFTHLPAKCKIRIYSIAGDLVRVLQHDSNIDDNDGTEKWDLLTPYLKRVASGIYIYHVDAPGIGTKIGKFAIIK